MTKLAPQDWNERYLQNDTPWDLSGPTPEFVRLSEESWFPRRGRALVPGGGRGHDAILLAQRGLETALCDFAPAALEAALIAASQAKATVYAYREDFFRLPELAYHKESYQLILEYTFFCAIDPSLRARYAESVARLLKSGGLLVGLFFPLKMDKAGPPFVISREEIEKTFRPYFTLRFEEARQSVKPRAGNEFVGIFTKK